jgi:predicted lipoprotein with Yx(FWY)xxD motif
MIANTRSRSITFLAGPGAVALAALALGAGGSGASASAASPKAAGRMPTAGLARHRRPTLAVRSSRLGKILVDSRGRTVYLFKKDSGTKSACFGACAAAWPPLRTSRKPTVGGGVKASKVGTTRRSDGKRQVTYNGHPLYRFVGDTKAGDTNGEGLTAFGARWFALSPAGRERA